MGTKTFTLPAGTICKRGGVPFILAADTVIECHPENWVLIQEGFVPSVGWGDQRLRLSQSAHSGENPCQAAGIPAMPTENNSLEV